MERKSLSALTALTLLGTGATHPAHSEAQQPIPQIASHEGHTPIAVAVPLDTYVASQSSETELLRLGERMRLKLTMSGPFEVAFATPLFKQRDPDTVMVSSPRKLIHLSSVDAYIMKVSSPEDISFLLDSNPAYIQDVSQDSIPLGMNPDVEELIRAPQATKRGATGSGWNIATIDTGVQEELLKASVLWQRDVLMVNGLIVLHMQRVHATYRLTIVYTVQLPPPLLLKCLIPVKLSI